MNEKANHLLIKAKELGINVVGKENTITMGQIITLARAMGISGFDVSEIIAYINL